MPGDRRDQNQIMVMRENLNPVVKSVPLKRPSMTAGRTSPNPTDGFPANTLMEYYKLINCISTTMFKKFN